MVDGRMRGGGRLVVVVVGIGALAALVVALRRDGPAVAPARDAADLLPSDRWVAS